MSVHTFAAMGTTFWLQVEGIAHEVLPCAERLVRDVEARLSRFLPGSALSRLNIEREMSDPMLAAVTREALRARDRTGGAFDPTLGDALIAAGYDRSFERLSPVEGRQVADDCRVRPPAPSAGRASRGHPLDLSNRELAVWIEGDRVRLTGTGMLDLGGIAKGWTVDRVAEQLEAAGATGWVVDGGGDIRVGGQPPDGEWRLGIGDDYAIGLVTGAVATSSSRKRRWRTLGGEGHHILDPRTGKPSAGAVDTAVVVAHDAITADVLATALIADFGGAWPALDRQGAAALVHTHAHGWQMTPNLEELLR